MYDVYIRVSRLGDRTEDEATEVYEAQCRDWANRNGVSIDEVEEDTDVSGSVAVAERKLERLIQKVEAGESEGIVTPYLDRFGRDIISGSVALKRIADAGGRLVCVNDGFDSTSPGWCANGMAESPVGEACRTSARKRTVSLFPQKATRGVAQGSDMVNTARSPAHRKEKRRRGMRAGR
jgi:DNA invertase Pin-like site-specific DNA recombinase